MITVTHMENLFRSFFKPLGVVLPLHADFTTSARGSVALGVRIIWKNTYPGMMFNRNSEINRLQLKQIYLDQGWNWRRDPLFRV